eukprot:maker-scaffold180_size281610-snap-gene-0.32 protein:Tk11856 transcript:maker-scaffold180_size281610-snap-gene-0.32-mRNA-1 annotation:"sin3 histone deacetylase corepressor complex component sds3"
MMNRLEPLEETHHYAATVEEPDEEDDLSEEPLESSGGEDTDDASEDDEHSSDQRQEFTEIKEQMYQDKLAELKNQLEKLRHGTLPEYVKKLRRLENLYKERKRVNAIIRELEGEMVDQDFVNEKKMAAKEFEDQKVFLREQLIAELEEKQKMIETERHNMELTGDTMELKPISTRKLRRRANEPSNSGGYGPGEKRRKPQPNAAINYLLEDSDILDDLKIINKNRAFSMPKVSAISSTSSASSNGSPSSNQLRETRIVDGKLFYERRWFRRGQAVQVETKSGEKYPGMISAIAGDAIWIRRTNESSKTRVYINQLIKGKVLLKRRAS